MIDRFLPIQRRAIGLALLCLSLSPLGADPTIVTLEGETIRAEAISIEGRTLTIAGGRTFDLARLKRIDHDRPPSSATPLEAPFRIDLAGGDQLYGKIEGSEAELADLHLSGVTFKKTSIPFNRIEQLIHRSHPDRSPLPPRPADLISDRIYMARETEARSIDGVVKSFTSDGARIYWDTAGKHIRLKFEVLRGIRFHVEPGPEAPSGVIARFLLVDGSRITGIDPILESDSYRFTLLEGGGSITISASSVARVDLTSDLLLFLSDLDPVESLPYDFTGSRSLFPPVSDRTVLGEPIRLLDPSIGQEKTHEKGLGVHAYSSLTYDLRRRYRRFRALVGLDPHAPFDPGSVVFRIWGDDRLLHETPILVADSVPLPLEIDVEGVKFLRLEVDFGPDLDMGDHAVWAGAVVLK